MKKLLKIAALSVTALTLAVAHADETAIKQMLAKSMPDVRVDSVRPSDIKGIYEVMVGANILYATEDGKYIFQGRLIDVESRADLTEQKLGAVRLAALDKLGEAKMIIFKAKIPKYTVTIFTDIDCAYCRKLHSEIDSYMAQGITIRYVFFPRAGKGSESYNKAVSVWCAKDRNAALTAAKKDQSIDNKSCENPVDEHMQLAADFDVKGTPMIITEKGNVYPGYLPAKELVQALEIEKKPR
ncbi:disulfide isomerase DsbC N-terminal domain-containing protein [Methylovulum psychrotolerans]|jgi:thiol:disulfide interchange protein DsbC|uniref:Thiol:disulfide interchange protein n=1 Tax=Methylovulum psychrotolerans TaxID=1704499 RepID=A0A1Z4C305_9GAMM|nr:thioredoxin fold domain-containing protein [Methylovulum psychrotolerans]ASF47894.1 disulfide bond formation protein DsbC [Methylovulum psychrotolerans]MBT9099869.1 thioredoxin fold domain-containing protein [Methylovulum psychrotolerans]